MFLHKLSPSISLAFSILFYNKKCLRHDFQKGTTFRFLFHYECITFSIFSLIRLEFNQSHLDYYTELDAVILYGKPARNETNKESKPSAAANKSEVSLTANLFRQLSLSDKKSEGQEDLENNGYFDILPVGHLRRVGFGCVIFR